MKGQLLLTAALAAAVMLWIGFLGSPSDPAPSPEPRAHSEAGPPSTDPGDPDGPEITAADEAAAALSSTEPMR